MVYQHPLAYLLGVQGVALLRAFAGEYDKDFTDARVADIGRLLDSPDAFGNGVEVPRVTAEEAYAVWAGDYDDPGNSLIELEEPLVREIFDGLPVGTALDAACGTGRHTAYLAGLGHEVIGVDATPEMLARARDKVPSAEFRTGDLYRLPVEDDRVDLVVCALALSHQPDLRPVFAEFARVVRPGGHVVVSDFRGLMLASPLSPMSQRTPDGQLGYLENHSHLTSHYLDAALAAGFQVRSCQEPTYGDVRPADSDYLPPERGPDEPPDVYQLQTWSPAATNAAYRGTPVAIVWHFQRENGLRGV